MKVTLFWDFLLLAFTQMDIPWYVKLLSKARLLKSLISHSRSLTVNLLQMLFCAQPLFMQVDCLPLFVQEHLLRLWHTLPVAESPRTLIARYQPILTLRLIVVGKLVLHGLSRLLSHMFLTLQTYLLMSNIAPSIWVLAWLLLWIWTMLTMWRKLSLIKDLSHLS